MAETPKQHKHVSLSEQRTYVKPLEDILCVPINATKMITSMQPLSEAPALLYRPKSSAKFSTLGGGHTHATAQRDKYGRGCVKKISSK